MNSLQKNKTRLLLFILILLNLYPLKAQVQFFVTINEDLEIKVMAGEEQHFLLSFQVKEGFHIQANEVKNENLIPTVLHLNAPDRVLIGEPIYPPPTKFEMEGAEESLLVFGDRLDIKIPIQIPKSNEETYTLEGKLHYQACDERKCFFPRDLPFKVKIKIE